MIALPNPTKILYTGLSSENTMNSHPLTDEILEQSPTTAGDN